MEYNITAMQYNIEGDIRGKIKCRLFNHSRTNQHVTVKAMGDGARIVLLMQTTKNVNCGEELLWTYGCIQIKPNE